MFVVWQSSYLANQIQIQWFNKRGKNTSDIAFLNNLSRDWPNIRCQDSKYFPIFSCVDTNKLYNSKLINNSIPISFQRWLYYFWKFFSFLPLNPFNLERSLFCCCGKFSDKRQRQRIVIKNEVLSLTQKLFQTKSVQGQKWDNLNDVLARLKRKNKKKKQTENAAIIKLLLDIFFYK
jgi:hypothetical protein